MRCPNCQTDNPDAARFCMNCGTVLQTITQAPISSPSMAVDADQAPRVEIRPPSVPVEAERKVVTILFCDVSESTALASQMDPEEWTEIMNTAFDRLISPVTRYDGTVARLMGDAILAFFGAPLAHEDDPQRAIMAGLEILQNIQDFREKVTNPLGIDFNVRIGVNTGLAVVGDVGSIQRMEYTAMGDAVNLAARMEQTAHPGTIQISEATYHLVAPLFETEPLGMIELKGKAEPVPAYRILRQKPGTFLTRGIQGLSAPLIGREGEFNTLQASIEQLVKHGRGGLVSIIGEAGLGKSRLAAELRKEASRTAQWVDHVQDLSKTGTPTRPVGVWAEGRSLSFENNIPYAPFTAIFRSLFDLSSSNVGSHYANIKTQVDSLFPARSDEIAPFLASMLGIEPEGNDAYRILYREPPLLREKVFTSVREAIQAITREGLTPVVLVIDDLHWADPTSLELLDAIIPICAEAPLLVITLFRPNLQDPSWKFHLACLQQNKIPYTTVPLDPLDREDSRLLVSSLLEIEDLPERVRNLILEKSEGNPFYVEEVIRSLIDSRLIVQQNHHWHATQEIETIGVPGTLAGVITARLDRLDPETKRIAQAASVIGRDFSPTLLYRILENPLDLTRPLQELGSRGLIREKPQNSHTIYTFKHALTQETVYGSILRSKKRMYHRKIARTLQQVNPEGVNAIAWHYLEANEPLQALPFIIDSGDRAARAYSTAEARQYYSKALAILNDHPDPLLSRRAFEGLGSALTFSNHLNAAVENYQSMFQLGQQFKDAPMQISALNKMSDVIAMRLGEFPKADDYLSTAERLAREVNDLPGLSEMYWIRCGICTTTGDFDTAVKYLDESVQIGRNLNLREQIAGSLAHIAGTLTLMARFDEGIQAANEAYDLSMELGIKVDIAQIQALAWPFIYLHQGNLDQAEEIAEKGVALAKDIGVSFLESIGSTTLGTIKESRGEYDQAVDTYKRALQAGQDSQVSWLVVMALGGLGAAYMEISESFLDQTGELHAQALEMMEHPAAMMGGGTAWRHVGYSFLKRGQIGKAIELFEKGLNTPTPLVVLNKPWFLLGLAEAALLEQDIELADNYLKTADQFSREHRLLFFEPHLASQQGYIALAKKDWEQANDSFNRCLETAIPREQRPLVLAAYIGKARAFAGLGMAGQAENSYSLAKQTGEAISRQFVDPVHRQLYQTRIHKDYEDGFRQIQLIG